MLNKQQKTYINQINKIDPSIALQISSNDTFRLFLLPTQEASQIIQ